MERIKKKRGWAGIDCVLFGRPFQAANYDRSWHWKQNHGGGVAPRGSEKHLHHNWIRIFSLSFLSYYVKVKGLSPLFYVVLLFSLLFLYFCLERQKSDLCNFLQFYYSLKLFLFSDPIKNRTLLLATGAEALLLFAVPFKNSTRKLGLCSFFRARKEQTTYYQNRTSVFTAKQIITESNLFISCEAAVPRISGSEARPHEWKVKASLQ